MNQVTSFLSQTRKAIGVAATLLGGWVTLVISSDTGGITKGEQVALVPIVLAILACYGLTNDEN